MQKTYRNGQFLKTHQVGNLSKKWFECSRTMFSLLQLFCFLNSIIIAISDYHYLKYNLEYTADTGEMLYFHFDKDSVDEMKLNAPEKDHIKRLLSLCRGRSDQARDVSVCDSKNFHAFIISNAVEAANEWNEKVHEMLQKEPWTLQEAPWKQPPITVRVRTFKDTTTIKDHVYRIEVAIYQTSSDYIYLTREMLQEDAEQRKMVEFMRTYIESTQLEMMRKVKYVKAALINIIQEIDSTQFRMTREVMDMMDAAMQEMKVIEQMGQEVDKLKQQVAEALGEDQGRRLIDVSHAVHMGTRPYDFVVIVFPLICAVVLGQYLLANV